MNPYWLCWPGAGREFSSQVLDLMEVTDYMYKLCGPYSSPYVRSMTTREFDSSSCDLPSSEAWLRRELGTHGLASLHPGPDIPCSCLLQAPAHVHFQYGQVKDVPWILRRAQRDMFRRKNRSTLGSRSVPKGTCSIEKTAAFSLREHTWISMRKQEDMFMRQTAAFARHEHTWISLRAQRDMFHRTDCCVLTPRAHLDLSPCAKRHVPVKRLLRSRAAPQDRWLLLADARSSFYSQARTRPLRYRQPVTRNPGHRAFALQIVDPISVDAVGESCLYN